MERYDQEFMRGYQTSAEAPVSACLRLVAAELGAIPATIVDVGCAAGAWVSELLKRGIDAVGWDGSWAQPYLVIPQKRFTALDLEAPLPRERRFDLAISIEVAEHLSPERGPAFVSDLCALSNAVLFSAALPGQSGTHHVNLQWQSYWVNLFAGVGYGVIDCVRPALWEAPQSVGWVLAQQCFLFVRGAVSRLAMPVDVVHPSMVKELIYPPRLRNVLAEVPRAVRRSARHRGQRLLRRERSGPHGTP